MRAWSNLILNDQCPSKTVRMRRSLGICARGSGFPLADARAKYKFQVACAGRAVINPCLEFVLRDVVQLPIQTDRGMFLENRSSPGRLGQRADVEHVNGRADLQGAAMRFGVLRRGVQHVVARQGVPDVSGPFAEGTALFIPIAAICGTSTAETLD